MNENSQINNDFNDLELAKKWNLEESECNILKSSIEKKSLIRFLNIMVNIFHFTR
jgi:hypothetical protein